jgi:hypothetical protein
VSDHSVPTVQGDDGALARWVAQHPGARVAFDPSPGSDLARAVGLARATPGASELPLDALYLDDGTLAVNMAVLGTPPDRVGRFTRPIALMLQVDGADVDCAGATTVVIATGQYLRGLDVVPRGHPGDGRLEVQVYRLLGRERREMRSRLPHGAHVPHPRITGRPGREVHAVARRPLALEVDGEARPPVRALSIEIVRGAYRLLI